MFPSNYQYFNDSIVLDKTVKELIRSFLEFLKCSLNDSQLKKSFNSTWFFLEAIIKAFCINKNFQDSKQQINEKSNPIIVESETIELLVSLFDVLSEKIEQVVTTKNEADFIFSCKNCNKSLAVFIKVQAFLNLFNKKIFI